MVRCLPFLLLLISFSSLFADTTFTTTLQKFQSSAVQLDFDLEIYWSVREKTEKKKGSLTLMGDERFNLRLGKNQWISDGITVWQHNGRTNQVIVQDFLDMDFSLHPSSMFQQFADKEFTPVSTKKGVTTYEWRAKIEEVSPYRVIEILYNTKKNRLKEIVMTDDEDNKSSYFFKRVSFPQKVADETFTFTLKEGMDVIDNR